MRQKLGQHFLVDETILEKIVDAIHPQSNEIIIEIGAGHGELTSRLEEGGEREDQKSKIIAIEKDTELANELRVKFANISGIEIVEGDALKLLPSITSNLSPATYCLAGNIPYYITGHLLRVASELEHKPGRCILLIQKEVAERIVSNPPDMNRLAASVQFWAESNILFSIPKESFDPPPKVESVVIMVETRDKRRGMDEAQYYKAVRALFQQPRKTIINNLATSDVGQEAKKDELTEKIKKMGVNPNDRPQNLSIEQIVLIASLFG